MNKQFVYLLIFITLIFFPTDIFPQINIGGIPYSFKNKENISKDIIFEEMKYVNIEKILENEKNRKGEGPWKFGENIYVSLNPQNSGEYEILDNGDKLWSLGIRSKGALTINLTFDKYKLPPGAVLYVYNRDKSQIIGGFTERNNQNDGVFATTLVRGDEIIIEYFEPANANFSGEINLYRVTHGYKSVEQFNKTFGNSGTCNMNVACDDAAGWEDQIRSVCMFVSGGSGFCTGTLINNTNEDGIPYILSADHCYRDPSSLVFWFNWESEICDNPSVSPLYNSMSGAVSRARNYVSDFWLIELNEEPPAEYNVYYSGWSIENTPSSSSVCIHHPNGDIKKISFDDDQSVSSDYEPGPLLPDSHWEIESWDRQTTTEAGSSGSPLFDQNHRITGQLHGGWAACGNTESDFYGKMSVSWDRGGSSSSQLKDWLDPDDIGVLTLDGADPKDLTYDIDIQILSIVSPLSKYVGEDRIIPDIIIKNRGIQTITSFIVKYRINEGNFVTKNWNGSLSSGQIVNFKSDEILLNKGINNFEFLVGKPNRVSDQYSDNNQLEKEVKVYTKIFEDDFETYKGWLLSGEFEIEEPEALGGSSGFKDPLSAFSGTKVLGTDLTGLGKSEGDYETNLSNREYEARSPSIDCRAYNNIYMSFKRWLGIGGDAGDGDNAYIDIYSGFEINNVWNNPFNDIVDMSWTDITYDISKYADNKKILLKFSLGETNNNMQYCGWNIDDFVVYGMEDDAETKVIREEKILVYPNPSDGKFTIDIIDRNNSDIKIQLYDIIGNLMYYKVFVEDAIGVFNSQENEKSLIYVDNLARFSGFFILKVIIGNKNYSKKIFIKN